MARFFLDESLPPDLCEALRELGHDCAHAVGAGLAGAPDEAIYAKAEDLHAVLVTLDLDFADVRRFQGDAPIVVLRLGVIASRRDIVDLAATRISRAGAEIEGLQSEIMILGPRGSRIRRKY